MSSPRPPSTFECMELRGRTELRMAQQALRPQPGCRASSSSLRAATMLSLASTGAARASACARPSLEMIAQRICGGAPLGAASAQAARSAVSETLRARGAGRRLRHGGAGPGFWGKGVKTVTAVDCHAAGEPARVIVAGAPEVPGVTMLEKRHAMMEDFDELRQLLLQEPRGYPCQNANVIYPSALEEAAYGYVILEQNKVYPAMSGHNTICVATALLETGMVPMTEPVTEFALEAPAGLIKIRAECANGKAVSIKLENVPAFVAHLDAVVNVPTIGPVTLDIAYGGMWYAIVDAPSIGLSLTPANGKEVCRVGEMIKVAAREQMPVQHPEIDYPGPDIICLRAPPPPGSSADAMNAVVMSNVVLDWDRPETWTGMLDRSPCGTGTCAVMATLHARGELAVGEPFVHESIIGSTFVGEVVAETEVAGVPAIVPTVSGSAWVTQHCQVVVDPTDPYPVGYTVGDIWG